MAHKKGNSLLETRRRNRVLIKNSIFRMKNATRTGIAEELGLTLPTITTSVNEMLSEGILEEVPIAQSELVNAMGRKPTAIVFKADTACAIGVELGPYATRAVLLNMEGNVLASSEEDVVDDDYERTLSRLKRQVEKLSRYASGRFLGVGVGLPGFVDCESGVIRSNPRKGWAGKHLAEDLQELLNVPVIIDNNVRIRAMGYELSQQEYKSDTFAYLFVSKGVACPIMVGDEIISGSTFGAGELGHTVVFMEEHGRAVPKCVDDVASERAIFEKCQKKLLEGGAAGLKRVLEENGRLTIRDVLAGQQKGDADVGEIMRDVMDCLGIALANVVNLMNPGFVVVDGYVMCGRQNRERLLSTAKANFYGLNEEEVRVFFQPYDSCWGAKCAAYYVISRLFLNC
jgi:predicted NBD/HSP70 family sugar kinase